MFGRAHALTRWLRGWLLAAFVTAISARAGAKPLALELVWNAPQGCPDSAQVLAAIHRLTGTTEVSGAPALWVQGNVERRGDTLVLKLVWRTASMQTERSMESSSCDELARAAALVVALAADPSAAQSVTTEPDPPPEPAPFAPKMQTEARAAKAPPRSRTADQSAGSPLFTAPASRAGDFNSYQARGARPESDTRGTLRAQLALDAGSLPRAAEGAALGGSLEFGSASLQAIVSLFVPQEKAATEGAAELWFGALAIHPCWAWSLSRLRLGPCAAVELDLLLGQGKGVDFRQQGAAWFPRAGGGVELGYSVSKRMAWIASGWLLAGPWRPTFVLQEVVPIHQPSLLVGRWTTGLELRL
jgi:hypothetical protein